MVKYAVFAGAFRGVPLVREQHGSLKTLVDLRVLKEPLSYGDVFQKSDIAMLFPGDTGIQATLDAMDLPERYIAFRAEVEDPERLREAIEKMKDRLRLVHRVYQTSNVSR